MAAGGIRSAVARRLADLLFDLSPPPSAGRLLQQLTVTPGPRARLQLDPGGLPDQAQQTILRRLQPSGGSDVIRGVSRDGRGRLTVELEPGQFRDAVIRDVSRRDQFWRGELTDAATGHHQPALVEFSSPNIAKPFHVGHLRSTLQGNFVSNVIEAVGPAAPVRLCYLGDWGAQFGMMSVGCDAAGLDVDTLSEGDAVARLLQVYVETTRRAGEDPSVRAEAAARFHLLESGAARERHRWSVCRRHSVASLRAAYSRLCVRFDHIDGESMYPADACADVLSRLAQRGVLADRGGATVARLSDGSEVTLTRADGSTMYLTRDLAACEDRLRRFGRRRMLYVVDAGQAQHFQHMRQLLLCLGHDWVATGLQHVPFGLVRGMSTRRGKAVFMHDLLDEARELMLERQLASPTTGALEDPALTADTVGISAVVVNDLRQRRRRDYTFSWDAALRPVGDGGVRLQYLHARLCSLQRRSKQPADPAASLETLTEPAALTLVAELARYEQTLLSAHAQLEPCRVVTYLCGLANAAGAALRQLPVKGAPRAEGAARLLLFHCARRTLAHGLGVLGLQPLERM